MAELTVDMTYGSALMEAARDTGKEDEILKQGLGVIGLMKEEPDLHAFMNYPGISAEEKKDVIKKIFEGKICDELLNFMFILVDKRRTGNFERIMKVYKNLVEREEGYSYGTIYSVINLSDDKMAEFEAQTSKLLQTKVKLENEIDPKLIAGVKILVEGKIIDASYKKKFDEMANQMNIS